MGSYVSRFTSIFKKKDPRTPVRGQKGLVERLKNIIVVHHRGIIGALVPLILLSWQPEKGKHDITVACLWFWMFWFFLFQPVNIPVVGFIPIFLLPMAGVMSTVNTCANYFDDNMALLILAGMNHLMLNSVGVDRRIILWFLSSGDSCQYSGKRMILKASTAAFFTSMISNRLIVTSTITQFLTPAYMSLQTSSSRYRATEPDYDIMRHVVLCAVQSASSIGSTAVMHASFATMAMRTIWCRHPPSHEEFPDLFNYLQYTCFAFPVALVMFIANFVYHMLLINCVVGRPMSGNSMAELKTIINKYNNDLPKEMSTFQKANIFFYAAFMAACFFRWSDWLSQGWSGFRQISSEVPMIKDATVAAMFIIGLHILPKSFSFLKYLTARTKSELGKVLKPDSPCMWWRYVDKNTNYGYIILIGGGVALNVAVTVSKLNEKITKTYAKPITKLNWNVSVLVVCILSTLLPNAMSSVAACCVLMPLVLNMAAETTTALSETPRSNWAKNLHLGALAVGVGSSLGFAGPFLYTPAYFCHYTGKVPVKQMVKFAIGSAVIAAIILWLAICFWAPLIWNFKDEGIKTYTVITTTIAAGDSTTTTSSPSEEG